MSITSSIKVIKSQCKLLNRDSVYYRGLSYDASLNVFRYLIRLQIDLSYIIIMLELVGRKYKVEFIFGDHSDRIFSFGVKNVKKNKLHSHIRCCFARSLQF